MYEMAILTPRFGEFEFFRPFSVLLLLDKKCGKIQIEIFQMSKKCGKFKFPQFCSEYHHFIHSMGFTCFDTWTFISFSPWMIFTNELLSDLVKQAHQGSPYVVIWQSN